MSQIMPFKSLNYLWGGQLSFWKLNTFCIDCRRGVPAQPISPGFCEYSLPSMNEVELQLEGSASQVNSSIAFSVPGKIRQLQKIKGVGFNFFGTQTIFFSVICLVVLIFLMTRSKCMHVTNSIVLHLNPQLGHWKKNLEIQLQTYICNITI